LSRGKLGECERAIFALQQQARGGTIDESELHRRLFEVLYPEKSTGHGGHAVTDRDIVTVTPRADRSHQSRPVENVGEGTHGAPAGASEDGASGKSSDPPVEAAMWLLSTGAKIITERMDIQPTLAATKIERWRQQGLPGDAVALRDIIERVDRAGYIDVRFHTGRAADGQRPAYGPGRGLMMAPTVQQIAHLTAARAAAARSLLRAADLAIEEINEHRWRVAGHVFWPATGSGAGPTAARAGRRGRHGRGDPGGG
jgi:hypothetical protein